MKEERKGPQSRSTPATEMMLMGLILWVVAAGPSLAQMSLGTGFTYQGQLKQGGSPANGTFDMEFRLFDGPDPGTALQLGPSLPMPGVSTSNGLFTVLLDFGDVFDGNARWLEIGVSPVPGDPVAYLAPLQPLTATPYALFALNSTPGADEDPANELQALSKSGNILTLSGGGGSVSADDADADVSNEIQSLSFNSSTRTLTISSGNSVTLPTGGSWIEVTADTGLFDTQCEYRWMVLSGFGVYDGAMFYASFVRPDLIGMDWSGTANLEVVSANKGETSGNVGVFPARTFRRCE